MREILSVENMRKSDANCIANEISSKELMYRAGEGVYRLLPKNKRPAAVLCGSGNNAGDGFVIAKLLREAGEEVSLLLLSGKFSEDGLYYYKQAVSAGAESIDCSGTDCEEKLNTLLPRFGLIIDCIFGTGFHGNASGNNLAAIRIANSSGAYIVSVDINSGLNGDSGLGGEHIKSDLTVSIGSLKPGHYLSMAKDSIGKLVNIDIGIRPVDRSFRLIEAEDVKKLIPPRKNYANKSDYGYAALIGGSLKYSGAIRLAAIANSCVRSGAGVVSIAAPLCICPLIAPQILEATLYPLRDNGDQFVFCEEEFARLVKRYDVIAFGMGAGLGIETEKAVSYLIENYDKKLIIDADGITALSKLSPEKIASSRASLILTPHPKEFASLSGQGVEDILNHPADSVTRLSKKLNAVILLKGAATIIGDRQDIIISASGSPGMASAGSGDVLSGIMAAFAAVIDEPLYAAAAASYVNGIAGELAEKEGCSLTMSAADTAAKVKVAIEEIIK